MSELVRDKVLDKLASDNMTEFDRGYVQGFYAYNDYPNVDDKKKDDTKTFFSRQKAAADKGSSYGKGVMSAIHDASIERKSQLNTAGHMPKSGGDKNMAKQRSTRQYSVQDKCDYYSRRANNPKLTEKQRQFAQQRLNKLCGGSKFNGKNATPSSGGTGKYTPEQKQAYQAGAAYGLAKTGKQMRVRDENKASFQAGVKAGRAGKYAK